MQLKQSTISLLENFATINNSVIIKKTPEGSTTTPVKTMDKQRTLFVDAVLDEVFPTNICIYDLKAFLSVLSSFSKDDVQVEFKDDHLTVSDGSSAVVKITYADPIVIVYTEKSVQLPSVDFTFELKQEAFGKVLNFSNLMALPNLRVFSKGDKLIMQATDKKAPNTNNYSVEVGTIDPSKNIDVYYRRDAIKFLPGDYKVSSNLAGLSLFENSTDSSLKYFVAHEK